MKRCPTCQQTYPDETLQFCRVDGALLIDETSSESSTRVLDQSGAIETQPTELLQRDATENQRTTSTLRTKPSPGIGSREQIDGKQKSGAGKRKLAVTIGIIIVVVVVPMVILGIAGYISYRHARDPEVAIDSIAVLPFENQTHDPDSEYLSELRV